MAEEVKDQLETFDVGVINKRFETSFEDEGSLKSALESVKKVGEYETKLKEYESKVNDYSQYQEKYTTLEGKYNTIIDEFKNGKLAPNKEVLALNQLSQKYKDVDLGVLQKVRTSDLSSIDKLEALVLANKLEVKSNASDEIRKKAILRQLGVENDLTDLTDDDRFMIDNAFASKAQKLEEIRNFQPEGLTLDLEAEFKSREEQKIAETKQKEDKLNSIRQTNEKMLKPLLDGFKEIQIPYQDESGKEALAKYVVEDDFSKTFFNEAVEDLVERGFVITADNAQEVASYISESYWRKNYKKMVDAAIRQALTTQKEAFHKQVHSDSPINRIEAPASQTKEPLTLRERMQQGLKI